MPLASTSLVDGGEFFEDVYIYIKEITLRGMYNVFQRSAIEIDRARCAPRDIQIVLSRSKTNAHRTVECMEKMIDCLSFAAFNSL